MKIENKEWYISLGFWVIFEAIAVILWLTKDNLFYLFNFSYIGTVIAIELINRALNDNVVNTTSTPRDNDVFTTTEKEEEKEDKKEAVASSPAPSNLDFLKFNDWLKRKAPFCSNPKNFSSQITEAEFLKLKEKYTGKQIADVIEQIENRKDLRKRYTNLYRTVLNWAKKEYEY